MSYYKQGGGAVMNTSSDSNDSNKKLKHIYSLRDGKVSAIHFDQVPTIKKQVEEQQVSEVMPLPKRHVYNISPTQQNQQKTVVSVDQVQLQNKNKKAAAAAGNNDDIIIQMAGSNKRDYNYYNQHMQLYSIGKPEATEAPGTGNNTTSTVTGTVSGPKKYTYEEILAMMAQSQPGQQYYIVQPDGSTVEHRSNYTVISNGESQTFNASQAPIIVNTNSSGNYPTHTTSSGGGYIVTRQTPGGTTYYENDQSVVYVIQPNKNKPHQYWSDNGADMTGQANNNTYQQPQPSQMPPYVYSPKNRTRVPTSNSNYPTNENFNSFQYTQRQ